jgi:hypothetical protein
MSKEDFEVHPIGTADRIIKLEYERDAAMAVIKDVYARLGLDFDGPIVAAAGIALLQAELADAKAFEAFVQKHGDYRKAFLRHEKVG